MPKNINNLDEQLYQELRKLANILMRSLLIDYGRHKATDKQQGAVQAASYTDSFGLSQEPLDMQSLQRAVKALEETDKRSHEITELVYFAAVPVLEVADLMNLSIASVERDLKFGRAYINDYIYNKC